MTSTSKSKDKKEEDTHTIKNEEGTLRSLKDVALEKSSKVKIPTFTLNNGKKIPAVGYGTWLSLSNEGEFSTADIPKFVEALSYAIDIGYRHIDTAHVYRVEPEIGDVVAQKIKDKVCRREELYIVTKVWQHNHRPVDVEKSTRASLKRLKMDYVDLLLVHWPMAISENGVDEKIDYVDSWRGFEQCLQSGIAKSIGVSNFNLEQLRRLIANCKIKPTVNQVEINLNLLQKELVDYCKQQNVRVVAYSPFGTMVPTRDTPGSPEPKLGHPELVKIAEKYRKTVVQVTLRYLYERGIVSIPKTLTKSRVLENAQVFDFELEAADRQLLERFDNGYRTVRPLFWQDYTHYPFEKVEAPKMAIPMSLKKWKNGAKQNID